MPMLVLWIWIKRAVLAVISLLVLVSFAPAQDADDAGRFEVSLGYAGVFSKTSTESTGNTSLKPTTSGGVLGTFGFRFNHLHGIELNIGHTSNSQIFTNPTDTFRVLTGISEYSGDYVLRPFHSKKFDPFVFAGAGMLRFNPGTQYIDGFQAGLGATSQRELTVLYGGGIDYRLWKALALRVQYRGLIYKVPDFKVPSLFLGVYGHMAEPSAGLVFKF